MSGILEIFLIIDALIIGVVATLALQHGLAHYKPDKHDAEKHPKPTATTPLSPEIKQQMQAKAAANFETIIDRYSSQLQKDLRASEDNLSSRFEKLNSALVQKETDKYETEIAKLHDNVEATDKSAENAINAEKTKLIAELETAMQAEKQRRIDQLDNKIADAVTSFLLETLGHEADLGAQEKYLLKQLGEHKAEIIKGVTDES